MEPKYIFAICALSVFFVLFIVFFALLSRKRKAEAKLQIWLNEVYSDKNLIKMDYDCADEEEPEPLKSTAAQTEGGNVEEVAVAADEPQPKSEEVYDKIEIEGIEEITGNYIPK